MLLSKPTLCATKPLMVCAWVRSPTRARRPYATKGVESPFGSCGSLAVTEKDTVGCFSTAKKYA